MGFDLSLLGFVVASLVVLLIPGPGVLYIVARSLSQGQRAGLISVLGLSTGALVHVVAATVGLSAILLTSATAFTVVKVLGAGYLVYLGICALSSPQSAQSGSKMPAARSSWRLFTDGVLISVLNPKIAVFFLAYLPQFVVPGAAPATRQVFFLGILYVAMALITDSGYALLAGRIRRWFGRGIFRAPLPQYTSGVVYLGLGISTVFVDRAEN